MFSAFDFNSWLGSLGIVLSLGCLIIGFGWFVTLLITRIWGVGTEIEASPRMTRAEREASMRKAA